MRSLDLNTKERCDLKQYLNIRGTQTTVPNLEVNVDTVYLRNNIARIDSEDFTGWQYDEIQYSLREYQEILGNNTSDLKFDINDVAETVAYTVEDSIAIGEMIAYLLEQNSILTTRIEQLENGGVK